MVCFVYYLNLPQFLFTWDDLKKVREQQIQKEVVGLAVINDIDREINDEYLAALENKGERHILWSHRHTSENIEKLKSVA